LPALSFLVLSLQLAFIVFAVDPLGARTIAVSPGPHTIQSAMSEALPGDTVLAGPGRYLLDSGVPVSGGVTLRSSHGPLATILDAQFDLFNIAVIGIVDASPPPTVEGFTLTGGVHIFTSAGGGIHITGSSPLIQNNLIVDNLSQNFEGGPGGGCGIGVFGGNPTIRQNTIVANHCMLGAIRLLRSQGSWRTT
jgi:hypothetical protein